MERVEIEGIPHLVGYHTMEHRKREGFLNSPVEGIFRCWLGKGYYFWTEIKWAHEWGMEEKQGKSPSKMYDVYCALLDIRGCLDTSFNERGYFLFVNKVDMAVEKLKRRGISVGIVGYRYMAETWSKGHNF